MSKIKEQNSSERLESAENTEDQEFDKWVRHQFLEEAKDIEKEIGQIPKPGNLRKKNFRNFYRKQKSREQSRTRQTLYRREIVKKIETKRIKTRIEKKN